MMQIDWHDPSQPLVPYHLAEAMERSRFGIPGLMFSAVIGLATLAGMVAGIVTPAPAREAPILPAHLQPAEECSVAELACTYSTDLPRDSADLRAAAAPLRR